MLTLVAVVHILVALVLIGLVLVQDSKGGGASGILGGGGSNSLLGATGATTLFEKMTRWLAFGFAGTCILLTVLSTHQKGSVVDNLPVSEQPAAQPPATPEQTPVTPPPAASPEAPEKTK